MLRVPWRRPRERARWLPILSSCCYPASSARGFKRDGAGNRPAFLPSQTRTRRKIAPTFVCPCLRQQDSSKGANAVRNFENQTQRARRANERHGSCAREAGERLPSPEQSRGCARGRVRRVRGCAADGKALVRHRALVVFRTVRGLRADPTDPPPRRHITAGTKRRPKMRSSGPRVLTRALSRSARACLGACPRATCVFPLRNHRSTRFPNVDHPCDHPC